MRSDPAERGETPVTAANISVTVLTLVLKRVLLDG